EPGHYAAVLEPYAVAELLRWFSYDSLGALGFLEERSYFCGRLGEQAFDAKVSIADDALDPRNLPKAFDFEGTPKRRVELVRDGVLPGMTRDGTFRIRDGRGAEPLVNLRFTVSMAEVLGDVAALTRTSKLVNLNDLYDERYPYAALVPALATARFNITGTGSG